MPQVGVSLTQRLLQWGDHLTHTLWGSETPHKVEPGPLPDPTGTEEKQSSWWERLNQAAGTYADSSPSSSNPEGLPFARWTKLRKALEEAIKEARMGTGRTVVGLEVPSPRESIPEMLTKTPASETESSPGIAAEWKPETNPSGTGEAGAQGADGKSEAGNTPAKGQRLGWLFGATYPSVSGSPTEPDSSMPKSRHLSSWLPPSMNVLALVMKSALAEKSWAEESWEEGQPGSLQSYRKHLEEVKDAPQESAASAPEFSTAEMEARIKLQARDSGLSRHAFAEGRRMTPAGPVPNLGAFSGRSE
uniref:Uncharacterized protein n=1 Tax=Sphaerodactylus townsendi TaxID=933632 RepID=A0ACB8GBQ4_9SAUR